MKNIYLISKLCFVFLIFFGARAWASDMAEVLAPASEVEKYLGECSLLLAPEQQTRLDDKKLSGIIDSLKKYLNAEIAGQDAAVDAFGDAFETIMSFLYDPEKPMMRLFFLGPTGVGKTEMVRSLVRFLEGNPDVDMIRVDGGTMQAAHDISRLKGAPPSYAGYGDMPLFHPERIRKVILKIVLVDGTTIEFTILLLDEIEKMNDAAFDFALGILDNGQVPLGDNTTSNMRKTLVIATSNEGAKEVEALIEAQKLINALRTEKGEDLTEEEKDLTGRKNLTLRQKIFQTYIEAVKKRFKPEFINRWQKFVQFLHLGREEFNTIADILLVKTQKRVFRNAKVKFALDVTPAAKDWLVSKGTDFRNGARELGNIVELNLTARLARLVSTEEIKEGDVIRVSVADDALSFTYLGRGLSREQVRAAADRVFPGGGMLKVEFSDIPTQELADKSKIVESLVFELAKYREAGQGIWTDAEKSAELVSNVKSAEGDEGVSTYKFISVDGVIVRLSFKGVQAERKLDVQWKIESEGIPPHDRPTYDHGKAISEYSIARLEQLLSNLKKQN